MQLFIEHFWSFVYFDEIFSLTQTHLLKPLEKVTKQEPGWRELCTSYAIFHTVVAYTIHFSMVRYFFAKYQLCVIMKTQFSYIVNYQHHVIKITIILVIINLLLQIVYITVKIDIIYL